MQLCKVHPKQYLNSQNEYNSSKMLNVELEIMQKNMYKCCVKK